jgi:hypothetical protein
LAAPLGADGASLPLTESAKGRLLSILPPEESILLVLNDSLNREEVEASRRGNEAYLSRRGVGETEPTRFPKGTRVAFEVTVPVVERLIRRGDSLHCPEKAPELREEFFEEARVGAPWRGLIAFSGGPRLKLVVSGLPDWMTAVTKDRIVSLSGAPDQEGPVLFSVAAFAGGALFTRPYALEVLPAAP